MWGESMLAAALLFACNSVHGVGQVLRADMAELPRAGWCAVSDGAAGERDDSAGAAAAARGADGTCRDRPGPNWTAGRGGPDHSQRGSRGGAARGDGDPKWPADGGLHGATR